MISLPVYDHPDGLYEVILEPVVSWEAIATLPVGSKVQMKVTKRKYRTERVEE